MAFTVTTTGTLGTISLNDLGGRQLVHPITINLELEYSLDQLITSDDLETALSAGHVTITDGDNNNITTLSNVRMLKSSYDTNNDKIVENSLQLGGQTGSFYLDAGNLTGTLANDVETGLSIYPLVITGNELISGGASWVSGLTFSVTNLEYTINGVIYAATASLVQLATPDPTNDRIDVIYVDINGNIGSLTGVPAPNPVKPIVDDDTQIEVTFVTVKPGGVNVDITQIYNENAGSPTEWPNTTFGNLSNLTNDALLGTTSLEATNATGSSYATFSATQSVITQFNLLDISVKSKGTWQETDNIKMTFTLNGSNIGKSIKILDGTLGFDSSNTTDWQTLSFKKTSFALPNEIDGFRLDVGSQNGIGFYVDNIRLQRGLSTISNEAATIEDLEAGLIGAYALLYFNNNTTVTTNAGLSTPHKIQGTTVVSVIQGFSTESLPNRLRFTEPDTRTFEIECNLAVSSSNSNQDYQFYFYKNGATIQQQSVSNVQFSSGGVTQNVVIGDFIELAQDEYVELWCQNDTSPSQTRTVTVTDFNLRIKKIN